MDRILFRDDATGVVVGSYANGWFAGKIRQKKAGGEAIGQQSFHQTAGGALRNAAERLADASTAKDLEHYAERLERAVAKIEKLVVGK